MGQMFNFRLRILWFNVGGVAAWMPRLALPAGALCGDACRQGSLDGGGRAIHHHEGQLAVPHALGSPSCYPALFWGPGAGQGCRHGRPHREGVQGAFSRLRWRQPGHSEPTAALGHCGAASPCRNLQKSQCHFLFRSTRREHCLSKSPHPRARRRTRKASQNGVG